MESSAGIERLPRGRHHLPRETVARNQRERLIAALVECAYEQGYEKTTVGALGKRAGVSKGDFYKQFGNKHDCLVAAYDIGVERLRLRERVLAACAGRRDWAQGVCSAAASSRVRPGASRSSSPSWPSSPSPPTSAPPRRGA